MARKIIVLPHDPSWPAQFQREAEWLYQLKGLEIVAIHHFGSTIIPDIYAKPIIDVLIEVREIDQVDALAEEMNQLGYIPKGEFGIPGRRFFIKGTEEERTHHLHFYRAGHPEVQRHIDFRDYMIAHPQEAEAYSQLKIELAKMFPTDIDNYNNGKTGFIKEIDRKAEIWRMNRKEDSTIHMQETGGTMINLIQDLTPQKLAASTLSWAHPPEKWGPLSEGGIRVAVPSRVDYFQDPAGMLQKDDAPYLWASVQGDFVAQVHVQPHFTSTWDAGAIMARQDAQHWAKLCYESTDLGPSAAVSVVTNGVSDDANGVELTAADLWLQLFRAGDVFGMHYALDGRSWRMVRLFKLPLSQTIQVGLVAQCPAGPGTTVDFHSFSIDRRLVTDLRAGF